MEVYLDNSATTRGYTEVGELVYKVMCQDYGNPSSMHRKGVDAEHYIKDAKEILAKILKVNAKEIYFTSGGTLPLSLLQLPLLPLQSRLPDR